MKKESRKKSEKGNKKKESFFHKAWIFLAKKEIYRPSSVIGVFFILLIGWIHYGANIQYGLMGFNPLTIEIKENVLDLSEDSQFKVYVVNKYKKEVYAEMTTPIANDPNNFIVSCDSLFPPAKAEEYRCSGDKYEDQNFKEGWDLFTFNLTAINKSKIKNNTQLCVKLSPIDYEEKEDCISIIQ